MSKNRRKHIRVRARNVSAQLLTAHGRTRVELENISRGGAFVRSEHPLDVGSDVIIELSRAGLRRPLTLGARITSRIDALESRLSRRLPGMGMQFKSIDPRQTERLADLLRDLGAPGDEADVTLSPEHAEPELQALEIDHHGRLQQRPQPAAPAARPARGGVKFELPRRLADDIAGVLNEMEVPAPPPLDAPPVRLPGPGDALGETPESTQNARLMVQIRGLVMQLSEAQQQVSNLNLEVERMREDLETARETRDAEIERLRAELAALRRR